MPRRAGKSITDYKEHNRQVDRFLLDAVGALAPGVPGECSTHELVQHMRSAGLDLSPRSIAARLIRLRTQGFVFYRELLQRHLWGLTIKGKQCLR